VTTESNVPATTDEVAVPAVVDGSDVAPVATTRRGQNITTGLFPMALFVLIILFVALAFWTLMTTTGTGP
jgi:hypothetical protein